MKVLTLCLTTLLTLGAASTAAAQRLEPVWSEGSRANPVQRPTRTPAPSVELRQLNPAGAVIGGILGGGVGLLGGAYLGAALNSAGGCRGEDCGLYGAIVGGLIGESLGVPFGVHLGGGSWHNFGLSLLASAGLTLAGTLLAQSVDRGGSNAGTAVLVMVPVAQISTALVLGRARGR